MTNHVFYLGEWHLFTEQLRRAELRWSLPRWIPGRLTEWLTSHWPEWALPLPDVFISANLGKTWTQVSLRTLKDESAAAGKIVSAPVANTGVVFEQLVGMLQ